MVLVIFVYTTGDWYVSKLSAPIVDLNNLSGGLILHILSVSDLISCVNIGKQWLCDFSRSWEDECHLILTQIFGTPSPVNFPINSCVDLSAILSGGVWRGDLWSSHITSTPELWSFQLLWWSSFIWNVWKSSMHSITSIILSWHFWNGTLILCAANCFRSPLLMSTELCLWLVLVNG